MHKYITPYQIAEYHGQYSTRLVNILRELTKTSPNWKDKSYSNLIDRLKRLSEKKISPSKLIEIFDLALTIQLYQNEPHNNELQKQFFNSYIDQKSPTPSKNIDITASLKMTEAFKNKNLNQAFSILGAIIGAYTDFESVINLSK